MSMLPSAHLFPAGSIFDDDDGWAFREPPRGQNARLPITSNYFRHPWLLS
ncbi:unnamed protein product, partial [Ixodes hexagonus]